jgi:DNA-directed RNA polymerase specialized sigma24 family protein
MELTQDMIDYCESQPWDDDLRQEVYIKVLEADEADVNHPWLSRLYTNALADQHQVSMRRNELMEGHIDEVRRALGIEDLSADVVEELSAVEEIIWKLKDLSPLLRATLYKMLIEGKNPDEVANDERTTPNVIYKRLHTIKQQLTGS